jgi:hypothetical protein
MNSSAVTVFSSTRRQFMGRTALASGAAAVSVPGFAKALSAPAASELAPELIHALGQRIAYDAVQALGTANLELLYVDHAGPALDALRQGMEHTLGQLSSYTVMSRELSGHYGSLVAQATFVEPISGRQFRANVPASAISQLSYIADASPSPAIQKQAVMAASHSQLYSA